MGGAGRIWKSARSIPTIGSMNTETPVDLDLRVDPDEMLRYVHDLMSLPRPGSEDTSAAAALRHWGADTAVARAAQLRWSALNRALGDARLTPWTPVRHRDRLHVPAALVAAAGVARLTMQGGEVVFDVDTLLDATLEMCEPGGHA